MLVLELKSVGKEKSHQRNNHISRDAVNTPWWCAPKHREELKLKQTPL